MNNIHDFDPEKEILKIYPSIANDDIKWESLIRRSAPLAMVGINARTYIHWREMGLVDEQPNEGGLRLWVRLNVYDFVWLSAIKEMREFGVPLETIKEMKIELSKSVLEEMLAEGATDSIEQLLKSDSNLSDEEIETRMNLIRIKDQYKLKFPPELKQLHSFFGALVNGIIFNNQQAGIVIYKTEDQFKYEPVPFSNLEIFDYTDREWFNNSHLMITLKKFVWEFIGNPRSEPYLNEWGFITKREKKVLKAIKDKSFKEIRIRRKGTEDEELIMEVDRDANILDEKAKEIRRILGMNEYSEINVKYRNDKNLYIVKTERI